MNFPLPHNCFHSAKALPRLWETFYKVWQISRFFSKALKAKGKHKTEKRRLKNLATLLCRQRSRDWSVKKMRVVEVEEEEEEEEDKVEEDKVEEDKVEEENKQEEENK